MKYFLAAAISFAFAAIAAGQTPSATLPASPSTVVWGYYWAEAKPVLTVHSGDTVRIQTLSTCGLVVTKLLSIDPAIFREAKMLNTPESLIHLC